MKDTTAVYRSGKCLARDRDVSPGSGWKISRLVLLASAVSLLPICSQPVPATALASAVKACIASSPADDDKSRLERLVETCTAALASAPSAIDRAAVLINRGVALRNLGQLDKSLADLSRAADIDRNNVTALKMKAWTLRELRRPAEAIALYDQVLALGPDAQAYLSRCVARIDLQLYAEALPDCAKADELVRSGDSLFFLAISLSELGRPEEALDAARQALLYEPVLPQHYVLIANLQERTGDRKGARHTARRAAQLYPEDSSIAALAQRLAAP